MFRIFYAIEYEENSGMTGFVRDGFGCMPSSEDILNLDGRIHADRFADSRESHDSRESFQGFRTRPFLANRPSGGQNLRIAGLRRFARIARTL